MPKIGEKERVLPSLWERHKERWKDCRRCSLCETRTRIVLFRGDIPCDVLLIGEAPGFSEDSTGIPFNGPSGRLLDQIVEKTQSRLQKILRVGFSNVVCCIPLDDQGDKVEQPDDLHVHACSERLLELVRICDPKLIVTVGSVARDTFDPARRDRVKIPCLEDGSVRQVHVEHPASMLRKPWATREMLFKRAVAVLQWEIGKCLREQEGVER